MKAAVAEFARSKPLDEEAWNEFAARLFFFRGDLNIAKNFGDLKERLEAIETGGSEGQPALLPRRAPSAIGAVVKNLGGGGWSCGSTAGRGRASSWRSRSGGTSPPPAH